MNRLDIFVSRRQRAVVGRGGSGGGDFGGKRRVRVGGQTIAKELRSNSETRTKENSRDEAVKERLDELGVVGREIIFRVQRTENDAKKETQEQASSKDDVKLSAASEGGVDGEGARAAEVADSQVDELGESKGQGERKSHSDECEAIGGEEQQKVPAKG